MIFIIDNNRFYRLVVAALINIYQLALLCFSPLAEALQVRDVIVDDHVNESSCSVCACKINPRKTNVSIFNGSQTLILSNLIQF